MKKMLAMLAVFMFAGFSEAREPLFPRVNAFLTGKTVCHSAPVRNAVYQVAEAAPVRTVSANVLTTTGNAFVQAGSLVLPTRSTCANGNCR